ncbi:CTD nuclear envelope phosphatase 1 [Galendromus occidentalis]|uniref:CTD nuclear envelope phosphatase 1 n=1 Tax=Galendromus occidentalis TaxID=34638 RepID=A0AAJ6QWS6_9ACAR|nr:CTD nuclear envelope phosphatase 1 [Galendromus occidentalis]
MPWCHNFDYPPRPYLMYPIRDYEPIGVDWRQPWGHASYNDDGFLVIGTQPMRLHSHLSVELHSIRITSAQRPELQTPIEATQVCFDENPDRFVLSPSDRLLFRQLFPLRRALLPPKAEGDDRPTLVLDLDETLIHTTFECPPGAHDVEQLCAIMRPNVRSFLRTTSRWYEIVVYTAALPSYADSILDGLDPHRKYFSYRLYRGHCSFYQGVYVKDLEALGRPMSKVVFVDNFPGAYMMQPSNALPIRSFVGDNNDKALLSILKLLKILKGKNDVRPMLRRYRNQWKRIHFCPDQDRALEEYDEEVED